ncbi:MAG: DUF4118 domain-containing protein [Actinomycetes bacterium]
MEASGSDASHKWLVRTPLSGSRRGLGFALMVFMLAFLSAVLIPWRGQIALVTVMMLYLLAVVVVAVAGGLVPSVLCAALAFVAVNYFFVRPYGTLRVEQPQNLVELLVFLVVAVVVGVLVEIAARRRAGEERALLQARLLTRAASGPVESATAHAVLEDVRSTFEMTSVALVDVTPGGEVTVERTGPDDPSEPTTSVPAEGSLVLRVWGGSRMALDPETLRLMAAAAGRAWESERLSREAQKARELTAVDELRSALLAAVGHELRTPLAGITASVTSLRASDVELSASDRDELLETIESSASRLDELLDNLLALSRLQAGVLSVTLTDLAVDEIVARALIEGPTGGVVLDVPDDLPLVKADVGLLERVVANLLSNARRFSGGGQPVEALATLDGGFVALRIRDHGPGVPSDRRESMFRPFQRLDDRSPNGVGLGLAIARGFTEAMGGSLAAEETPGGGLTMCVRLPVSNDTGGAD